MYKNKYKFTTCRKFKGLEADAVILVDIDENTFDKENKLLFYVGTSRARFKLDLITKLSEEECIKILVNNLDVSKKIKNGKKELANKLNAIAINVK